MDLKQSDFFENSNIIKKSTMTAVLLVKGFMTPQGNAEARHVSDKAHAGTLNQNLLMPAFSVTSRMQLSGQTIPSGCVMKEPSKSSPTNRPQLKKSRAFAKQVLNPPQDAYVIVGLV